MNHPIATYMDPFFNQYLAAQRGLAANTIIAYRDGLKLLLCYTADTLKKSVDDLSIEDLDETRILAFLDQMEDSGKWNVNTRNLRLTGYRTFFGFIAREEPSLILHCQKVRTIPRKRTEHKTVPYLEEEEMQGLFDSVDPKSRTGIRDKALLLFAYNTGARASEIVGVRRADLRLDTSGQVKVIGKGKKQRSCPLWPETVEAINAYLAQRTPQDPNEDHVFLNARGGPLTRFGLRYIIKKYAVATQTKAPTIEGKPVGPHTIRHSTAMHLLRAGNDINMVRCWLGHADLNTTHAYVEIDMEMKRKMLEKAEAPAGKKTPEWRQPKVLEWLNRLDK